MSSHRSNVPEELPIFSSGRFFSLANTLIHNSVFPKYTQTDLSWRTHIYQGFYKINNKDQLYSIGNSTQYFAMTYIEKESEKDLK